MHNVVEMISVGMKNGLTWCMTQCGGIKTNGV